MSEIQRFELKYSPHQFQLHLSEMMRRYRFGVVVAHRRWGKSTWAKMTLLHGAMANKRSERPHYAYVAPRLKQAKTIAWQDLVDRTRGIPGIKHHESELYIGFPHNGARLSLYGASEGNEEAMRGIGLDGVVVDEVAGIPGHVWGEIIRPALMDRKGWALFIGTPKGQDAFYELWNRARQDDQWHTAMYRADETVGIIPWITQEELDLARSTMTDSQYRQEMLCDFTASAENILIPIDLVSQACQRDYKQEEIAYAPVVLGVDVARYGDDRSVIIRRQGLAAFDPIVLKNVDNMTLAGRVAEEINKYKAEGVFIDAGRGEGVIDRLRQLGFRIHEINFGGRPIDERYHDRRSEMWSRMAEWLHQGGAIPNRTDLKSDLCIPTYEFTTIGKVRLESKDKIKERGLQSTDIGDALALTFAMPVVSRQRQLTRRYSLAVME